MAVGARTLERSITQALLVLVALTTLASASLIVITSVLHDTTQTLSSSVETVRIAKDAQRDLLLHARAHDDISRSERANDLRMHLSDASHYVTGQEEERVFERADQSVSAYLRAADTTVEEQLEPAALAALGDLVRVNLSQAGDAQKRATELDTVANIVGVGTAISVFIGALGLGWWVRTCVLRPVLGLARAIRSFGPGSEGSRVREDGPEELRDMAHQFNSMADRLAEQRSAHRTYLAAVAHDLRNPLSTLQLAVDTFTGGAAVDCSRVERVLLIVRRQIARLTRLADDLLDTANLEAGRVVLHTDEHDVRDVARATVDLFRASYSKHTIELALPAQPVIVDCDGHRIEQVLANLVGNAVKYSPAGGTVLVSVEPKEENVEVAVEDHGVGMTPDEIEKSFQPFARAATLREAVPGHGLGLFISRRIVEEHGGSMSVESASGRGSIFRISLPKERPKPVSVEGASEQASVLKATPVEA